jgi:hypothetical protein
MIADMEYDGQVLSWPGYGFFEASSGLPGYQQPAYQCTPDQGPLPEGFYRVLLNDQGTARDDGTNRCNLAAGWGLQSIPRGAAAGPCEPFWANWGFNRARLEPADTATAHACIPHRGGFYQHDSTKGYSHGCIEVDGKLFPILRSYGRTGKKVLILRVKYAPGRITYGGTLKTRLGP